MRPAGDGGAARPLLVVVGLRREAELVGGDARVMIGTADLAANIAGAAGVISFGLCGALDPGLHVGDLIVGDGVVTAEARFATDAVWTLALRRALPGARSGDMAGSDEIAETSAAKAALRARTGAVAVDMESHAVARAASGAGAPFAIVRAVSDDASRSLPRAAEAGFSVSGEPDIAAVLRTLARRPWELPSLIRTALEAETAFRALRGAAAALTPPPR